MGGQQTNKLWIAECGITSRVLGFKDSREQQGQVYFLFMLILAGRGQVREYAIEEKYRAPSRMGIENSGEA